MVNCSHVPARWVSRHANPRRMLVNGAIKVYFGTTFPSENSRNLHLLHKNNAIVVKPLLGSLGKE